MRVTEPFRVFSAVRPVPTATFLSIALTLSAVLPFGGIGPSGGSPVAGSGAQTALAAEAATTTFVGYGKNTVGGRGGTKRFVTNLHDSGPGSLRNALEAHGRRVVLFKVSGTINLNEPIKIKDPFITVKGQSAPGKGITVRGDAVVVLTHDVILRHLRLRPGDRTQSPSETDALTINGKGGGGVYNVVVDHLSMLWGPDIGGLAILGDVSNVTIQNSIMGEGLYLSAHPEGNRSHGGHSMGANITQEGGRQLPPRKLTFWHNLFTTSDERMPRLQGARCVDVVNNVIYNWGSRSAAGNPRSLNLLGNYYRRGPRTQTLEIWHSSTSSVAPSLFIDSVFQRGNVTDGFAFRRGGVDRVFTSNSKCGGSSVARTPASAARTAVITNAGATMPARDSVDRRIISNFRNRVGRYFNGAGFPAPNPYWP